MLQIRCSNTHADGQILSNCYTAVSCDCNQQGEKRHDETCLHPTMLHGTSVCMQHHTVSSITTFELCLYARRVDHSRHHGDGRLMPFVVMAGDLKYNKCSHGLGDPELKNSIRQCVPLAETHLERGCQPGQESQLLPSGWLTSAPLAWARLEGHTCGQQRVCY